MKFCWMPVAILALAPTVGASQVLDQSFESYGGYGSTSFEWRIAQTVVAGITGKLVRVELALRPGLDIRNLGHTEEAKVEIAKTYNHVPRALDEDVLASAVASFPDPAFNPVASAPSTSAQPFLWVPFEIPPIDIVEGEEFAIVLEPLLPEGGPQWAMAYPGTYPSGEGYAGTPSNMEHPLNYNERDNLFRTFVIPIPEPTSGSLGLFATLFYSGRRRRNVRRRAQPS